jgi:hypothetical protein
MPMEAQMRINSRSILLNRSTQGTVKSTQATTSKETFLGNMQGCMSIEEKDVHPALISRRELLSLASDLKRGLIDCDKAHNRFIGTVVHNTIKDKLSEKDKEKLIGDISQFFLHDPDFLKELEKNLFTLN